MTRVKVGDRVTIEPILAKHNLIGDYNLDPKDVYKRQGLVRERRSYRLMSTTAMAGEANRVSLRKLANHI